MPGDMTNPMPTDTAHPLARLWRGLTSRSATATPPQTVVVVGNGMVGHHLCEQLAKLGATRRYRIIVFGEEPRPAYDRIHLTRLLTGDGSESDPDDREDDSLALGTREWYRKQCIVLYTGDPVKEIDRDARVVRSSTGREVAYDHLVLATGSRPFVPPVEGADLPGVFLYRTVEDLRSIRRQARRSASAIVIGGGLLGLEAARALMDLGMRTHVVELAGWLMPQQLTEKSAAVLEAHVRELGVGVHKRKRTERIAARRDDLALEFADGTELAADMIVISAGIRARDELAYACGLECDTAVAGVVVDDELRTSDPDISAIGECAVHRGRVYGLAAPGYRMADAVAARLLGRRRDGTFTGGDLSTRLKLLGVDVAVLGDYRAEAAERLIWEDTGARREVLVRDGRIVGAIVVGDWSQVAALRAAVDRSKKITPRNVERFRETGDLWPGGGAPSVTDWPDAAVVCNCKGITAGTLRAQVADGCRTVERLAAGCGASTVCGSCKPMLAELVGSDAPPVAVSGWRSFAAASIVAAIAAMVVALLPALPFVESVTAAWHEIDLLWRDSFLKQVTGYTLLGVCVLAGVLSLRKRIRWFRLGAFGWWRFAHGVIGIIGLVAVIAHTGFRMGHHMNFALMSVFLLLSLLGGVAGLVTAMESQGGRPAAIARRWRPYLTWAHILLLWPMPVLIGFHIAAVYYF